MGSRRGSMKVPDPANSANSDAETRNDRPSPKQIQNKLFDACVDRAPGPYAGAMALVVAGLDYDAMASGSKQVAPDRTRDWVAAPSSHRGVKPRLAPAGGCTWQRLAR